MSAALSRSRAGCRILAAAFAAAVVSMPCVAATPHQKPANKESIDVITVVGRRARLSGPLRIDLTAKDLISVPGTQNDPLGVIATLPGVAVNTDFSRGVAIRGARPGDNRYYLDFLPTGYLFHLTGLSVVDSDLVSHLSMYPAGFGAEYQGVIGGVISADTREPARDRVRARAHASFLDAGATVEGPIAPHQHAMLSARMSYYDLIIGSLVKKSKTSRQTGVDIIQLPRYRDYRGKYEIDAGAGRIDLLVDGATDDIRFLVNDTAPEAVLDPATAGFYRYDLKYDRQGVVYSNGNIRAGAGRIRNLVSGRFGGTGQLDRKTVESVFRLVDDAAFGPNDIKWGLDISDMAVNYDVILRDTGCTQFDVNCRFTGRQFRTTAIDTRYVKKHLFAQDTVQMTEDTSFTLGAGYLADTYLHRSRVEPRFRLDMNLSPGVSIHVGGGRYSEMPELKYIDPNLGNPALGYLQSNQVVTGVTFALNPDTLAEVNAYYKSMENLVTSDPVTRYGDRGTGRAFGTELMLLEQAGPLSGWLSLTWSRSIRKNLATGQSMSFEFDQPLILSAVAKYALNDRMKLSGRLAFHSGRPYTPILGGTPDPASSGSWLPVYGAINGNRMPNYFRADIRFDWKIHWQKTRLYFEIINATDHRNVAGYQYSADYSTRKPVEQLPLIVSVGAEWRWPK